MLGPHHKIVRPTAPLPTIQGKVRMILNCSKDLIRFFGLWCVLRANEPDRKNIGTWLILLNMLNNNNPKS